MFSTGAFLKNQRRVHCDLDPHQHRKWWCQFNRSSRSRIAMGKRIAKSVHSTRSEV